MTVAKEFLRLIIPLVVCSSVLVGTEKARKPFPNPNWRVKYESGPLGIKPGTWLIITFLSPVQRVSLETPLSTIPLGQITTVNFSAKAKRNSELLQGMTRSGCAYARSMMPKTPAQTELGALVVSKKSPGPLSQLVEKLNQRHSVRLDWKGDVASSLEVRVNECEYASFLATLRQLLGPRWREVVAESK
jgi:hypothetical protein